MGADELPDVTDSEHAAVLLDLDHCEATDHGVAVDHDGVDAVDEGAPREVELANRSHRFNLVGRAGHECVEVA